MDNVEYDQFVDQYGWAFGTAALVLYVAVAVIFFIAYVRIIQKAGYSGWWILVGLVPILNVVMFLVFAFSRWPVLRERDALRAGGAYPREGGTPQARGVVRWRLEVPYSPPRRMLGDMSAAEPTVS